MTVAKTTDAGKDRGIAFLKHPKNLIKEKNMVERLFTGLVSLLGNPSPTRTFEKEMLTYAKTEYGKDWRYAYEYMLTHKGAGPKMGVNI